jgi:hypothetical protein
MHFATEKRAASRFRRLAFQTEARKRSCRITATSGNEAYFIEKNLSMVRLQS